MSMNKALCTNGRLTLHGDYVVYHQDGVEFTLEGDEIPSLLKGSKKGNIFITTQKVIFASTTGSTYGSFSMNFHSIRNVEVKQPMFGANYVKGDVISEPDGGWHGRGTFKVTFNSGGAIEFAQNFKRAVASAHRPGTQPPPPAGQAPFMNGGGNYYNDMYPTQPGYYPAPGQAFYPAPAPAPGAYTGYPPPVGVMGQPPPYQPHENPPPYPGQAAPSAPPPPSDGYGSYSYGDAKAREAYSTGQNVYVPSPQVPPPYAPPPYGDADKKNV